MTAKQTSILDTARSLFAAHGIDGVSTARIAREAGVSEGLIFRHFRSKRGLVDAIVAAGDATDGARLEAVAAEPDATERILTLIDQAFAERGDEAAEHRRLSAHLGATGQGDHSGSGDDAADRHRALLIAAFKELDYEEPTQEGAFLHHALRGIERDVREGKVKSAAKLRAFVRGLYS